MGWGNIAFQIDATERFIQVAVCLTFLHNPFYSITQMDDVELVGTEDDRLHWAAVNQFLVKYQIKLFSMELRKMSNPCIVLPRKSTVDLLSDGQDVTTLTKEKPRV